MRAFIFGLVCLSGCAGASAPVETVAAERAPRAEPARRLSDEEAAQTHTQAMTVHVEAQALLAQCSTDAEEACQRALQFFEVAADTWRALIDGRPEDASPEWTFMLAQALQQLDRFEPAAVAAERYLATDATEWRLQAARLALAARERDAASVPVREDAPAAERGEVRPIDLPPAIGALVDARLRFADIVAAAGDEASEARGARLEAALALYRYGHWDRATEILSPLFDEGCTGDGAWAGAALAWRTLRAMAVALGQNDRVRELGGVVIDRECGFGAGAPSCGASSDDPRCIARADRVAWFLRGATQSIERARQARRAERAELWARAGDAFLAALETGELDARGRATALDEAARAYREGGAADRAAAVDARIVAEVDPRRLDASDRPLALAVSASALSRQLETALTASDHAAVVTLARRILAPALDLPELTTERERARSVLPTALVALNRGTEASRAYADLAAATDDPAVRRDAAFQSGLVLPCAAASRPLRAFVTEHRAEEESADFVVRALWRLAECGRRSPALLEEVAAAAEAHPRGLSAEAAGHGAEARFLLVDRGFASLTRFRIRVPGGEDVEDMVAGLDEALADPTAQLAELIDGYARVERINSARWSTAARQRSGAALEALERAVLDASWELPRNVASQRSLLGRAGFEMVRHNVEVRAAEILRVRGEAIRCRALVHYNRAVSIAAAGTVDSPELTTVRARLAEIRPPDRCPR